MIKNAHHRFKQIKLIKERKKNKEVFRGWMVGGEMGGGEKATESHPLGAFQHFSSLCKHNGTPITTTWSWHPGSSPLH